MNKLIQILEANKDKTVEEVLPLIQSIVCTNITPEFKKYDRAPIPIGVSDALASKVKLKRWDELAYSQKKLALDVIKPVNDLAFAELVQGSNSIYWFDIDYNVYVH